MMKPDLPTNCREHANGRVIAVDRHYVDGEVEWETATFLCGCDATLARYPGIEGSCAPPYWSLTETIFWKEGQA